ncbi:MAG: type III pantothenate kinase [Erysipelotrichales bacterium]|nr:type III pantothenate kinase [Erysipelotrichales bacterium]
MLLAVDIGNTNITYGLISEVGVVLGTFRITTKMPRTSDEFGMSLMSFLNSLHAEVTDIKDVIISSVVPKIMYAFTNSIRKYLLIEPMIVGPGIKTGISIKTESPKELGADKIVDAAAVYNTYGGNALILDFGTATTYDYIDENGTFLYSCISPGIEISANALWSQAAKLPEVEIQKPATILSKNTINSMQAGIVYGYIGQVEYIIKQFKKELNKPDMKVIATGGLGKIIYKETTMIDVYDPDLVFKGMKVIYDKNKTNE